MIARRESRPWLLPSGRAVVCAAVALLLVGGCTSPRRTPELAALYNRAAQQGDLDRNPVIVIPGILGSRLQQQETGRVVWGAFSGDYANPDKPEGARLTALPMAEGVPLAELRDDVVPDGVLADVRLDLLFLPIQLSAYRNVLIALGVGGYRDHTLGTAGTVDYGDDHFTCFQFDYDWRRDNVENAKRLHQFILETKAYVRAEQRERYGADREDIRFDIVAHSMGGLLTRYYLRYGGADLPADGSLPPLTWAGTEHVEKVIMVGTPNGGSAASLMQLVEDTKFAPIVPTYRAAIIGTMPSVYQLLPRSRQRAVVDAATGQPVGDLYDLELWKRMQWGLASPEQDRTLQMLLPDVDDAAERRRIALDHLGKCLLRARRFHAALDRPASPPEPVELHLFAGDAEPTLATIAVDAERGALRPQASAAGDGTVLRSSALGDERIGGTWGPRLQTPIDWTSVRFLFSDHLGMTRDAAFTDNVLYLLLEAPH